MSRKWSLRIKDALQAIEYIEEDTMDMTFEQYEEI